MELGEQSEQHVVFTLLKKIIAETWKEKKWNKTGIKLDKSTPNVRGT